ncbi:MAG TPA: NAD kinase [Saprospiraceae bacterium]|jgi:NAD+ kinase|nr:NAD kinase [Saprospiraceae bacterium]HRO08344.1 NAD kinase [Saprospiraceae bacterium]HRO72135.1 NAD kinase [Saprospiraceae bacterium]HRP41707.1 NAD kinase [Saprospiraceae bacterium]
MKVFIYGRTISSQEEFDYIAITLTSLEERKVQVFTNKRYYEDIAAYSDKFTFIQILTSYEEFGTSNLDFAITLGGDGTILEFMTLMRDKKLPILGINLGRLGVLATVEKKIIKKAVNQLLKHEYRIVERSVLKISSNKPIFKDFPYGLNDFTIYKRDTSSMITIHAYVDGILLNSYWADGLIISTPTGSTGYSLSCGGPIVFPSSNNFIITPIAPHNLNVRPIVLPDKKIISLKVEGRSDNFMCTLDSRYETVTNDHSIEISRGEFNVQFIQLTGHHFLKTLNEKLLWGLDKRN